MKARPPQNEHVRCVALAVALLGLTGCSSLTHGSVAPVVARERSDGSAGGAVAGHFGLGGRWHYDGTLPTALTHAVMPLGAETMVRLAVTSGFTSGAIGTGYYFTSDIGRHFVFGRLDGLLTVNGSDAVRAGGGVRAEGGFGYSLGESYVHYPGVVVDEQRRERRYVTFGIFGEYTGQFARAAEMPMAGLTIGYAFESVLLDVSSGRIFR